MKKKTKIALIVSSIIIVLLASLIVSSIFIFKSEKMTNYFYSKDLGFVEIKVTTMNWFQKIFGFFQQAVTFSPATANVNEQISLADSYQIQLLDLTGNECVKTIGIDIKKSNSIITTKSATYGGCNIAPITITASATFTPNASGTYSATTRYGVYTCEIISSQTNCVSTVKVITSQSLNSVIVSAPVSCPVDSCGNYEDYSGNEITGGKLQRKTCTEYGSAPTCDETSTYDYKTICSSGYYIEGTTNQEAPGEHNCILAQGEDCTNNASLCVSPQTCDPVNKICINPSCDANETDTCPDNYTLITSNCINGTLVPTTFTCENTGHTNVTTPNATQDCSTNSSLCNSNQTCVNKICVAKNATLSEITCWKSKTLIQQAAIGNDSLCDTIKITNPKSTDCQVVDKNYYSVQKDCEEANAGKPNYILYILVGSSALIIFIIIIIVVMRMKKK